MIATSNNTKRILNGNSKVSWLENSEETIFKPDFLDSDLNSCRRRHQHQHFLTRKSFINTETCFVRCLERLRHIPVNFYCLTNWAYDSICSSFIRKRETGGNRIMNLCKVWRFTDYGWPRSRRQKRDM